MNDRLPTANVIQGMTEATKKTKGKEHHPRINEVMAAETVWGNGHLPGQRQIFFEDIPPRRGRTFAIGGLCQPTLHLPPLGAKAVWHFHRIEGYTVCYE